MPLLPRRRASVGTIVVLTDDPRRTELGHDLCQKLPLDTLWVLGGCSLQLAKLRQLQRLGLSPQSDHYCVLLGGSDTVG